HDQQAHAADREDEQTSSVARLGHAIQTTPISIVRLTNGLCKIKVEGRRPIRQNGGMPTTATALTIGPHTVQPPVVLAPMAGITNAPFRTLCREFSGGKG